MDSRQRWRKKRSLSRTCTGRGRARTRRRRWIRIHQCVKTVAQWWEARVATCAQRPARLLDRHLERQCAEALGAAAAVAKHIGAALPAAAPQVALSRHQNALRSSQRHGPAHWHIGHALGPTTLATRRARARRSVDCRVWVPDHDRRPSLGPRRRTRCCRRCCWCRRRRWF